MIFVWQMIHDLKREWYCTVVCWGNLPRFGLCNSGWLIKNCSAKTCFGRPFEKGRMVRMYVLIACTAPTVMVFYCHLYHIPSHYSHCHMSYDHIMLFCSTFPCRALLGGSFTTLKSKIAIPFLFQQIERFERNISRQIKSKKATYNPNPTKSKPFPFHPFPFKFHLNSWILTTQTHTRGVDFKTKFMQVRGKKLKLALWVSRRFCWNRKSFGKLEISNPGVHWFTVDKYIIWSYLLICSFVWRDPQIIYSFLWRDPVFRIMFSKLRRYSA